MAGSWRSSTHAGRRYWFHLHTVHTHGRSTVREYVDLAHRQGIDQVVFLEHVRRRPTYQVDAFVGEVSAEATSVGLAAFVGFEAKILAGGHLDIDERLLASADVIGIAEHGYPGSADALARDFVDLVGSVTEQHPQQSFVWVHPGSWLRRSSDPAAGRAYQLMLGAALEAGVRIERNLKYDLVSEADFLALPPEAGVLGLDAHSVDDARARWASILEMEARR
jgi:histidinol phosphatase-like PHP family hydrolase